QSRGQTAGNVPLEAVGLLIKVLILGGSKSEDNRGWRESWGMRRGALAGRSSPRKIHKFGCIVEGESSSRLRRPPSLPSQVVDSGGAGNSRRPNGRCIQPLCDGVRNGVPGNEWLERPVPDW